MSRPVHRQGVSRLSLVLSEQLKPRRLSNKANTPAHTAASSQSESNRSRALAFYFRSELTFMTFFVSDERNKRAWPWCLSRVDKFSHHESLPPNDTRHLNLSRAQHARWLRIPRKLKLDTFMLASPERSETSSRACLDLHTKRDPPSIIIAKEHNSIFSYAKRSFKQKKRNSNEKDSS